MTTTIEQLKMVTENPLVFLQTAMIHQGKTPLTDREFLVGNLCAKGYTRNQIKTETGFNDDQIRNIFRRIKHKTFLGASDLPRHFHETVSDIPENSAPVVEFEEENEK